MKRAHVLVIEPSDIHGVHGFYCTLEDEEGKLWGSSIWSCTVWQALEFASNNARIVMELVR